jgi:alanine racemase
VDGAPIFAEVCPQALEANIAAIRRRAPGVPICAALKANAYGHGIRQVLPVLAAAGVERIAVANVDEALEARRLGWSRPILCLGAPVSAHCERDSVERARALMAADVHCTVSSIEEIRVLAAQAPAMGKAARIELKVDSGMGRMGLLVPAAAPLVAEAANCNAVQVCGLYTHLATADEPDPCFARQQLADFNSLRSELAARRISVGDCHAANSAGVFRLQESHMDLVRPGLAVYGYWGGPEGERPEDLHPVLRVVARLVAVRRLPAEHAVGYGCTYRTRRESLLGVVPMGYADGYRRLLSGDAVMTLEAIRGQPRRSIPVVGRVSMDQTTVDLTDAGDVRPGDPVIIIERDPAAPNSVEALARKLGTIPYEVTCLLGDRVRRVAAAQ